MQAASAFPNAGHRIGGISPKPLLWCLCQIALVAGVELSDELFHSVLGQGNVSESLRNAQDVAGFEAAHGFWFEPAIQSFFRHPHALFGVDRGWNVLMPFFTIMYGLGHVLVTLSFAVWLYFRRPHLFRFVRNIFLVTNALAVVLYETLPIAPPRLAGAFVYDGHPFRFADPIFGALAAAGKHTGAKLSFNEFAAMPSIHVAWALIVGVTLALTLKPRALRVLALLYPLLMLTTVIVTGNHYLIDALGSVAIVGIATAVCSLLAWRQGRAGSRSVAGDLPVDRPADELLWGSDRRHAA